jgi:hypothetical protein
MTQTRPLSSRRLGAAASVLTLAACSLVGPTAGERARHTEQMLAAAGFRQVLLDTPGKTAQLARFTPFKLHHYRGKDGKIRFWFGDPDYCHCAYIGNQAAFDKYQDLRIEAQNTREREAAAEENDDAAQEMQDLQAEPMMYPFGSTFAPGYGPAYEPIFSPPPGEYPGLYQPGFNP